MYKLGRIAFQTLVMEMPHGGKADLKLWRPAFEAVLGPLQEIIDKSARARDAAARLQQQQLQQAGLSAADRSCFKLRRRLCAHATGAVPPSGQ